MYQYIRYSRRTFARVPHAGEPRERNLKFKISKQKKQQKYSNFNFWCSKKIHIPPDLLFLIIQIYSMLFFILLRRHIGPVHWYQYSQHSRSCILDCQIFGKIICVSNCKQENCIKVILNLFVNSCLLS